MVYFFIRNVQRKNSWTSWDVNSTHASSSDQTTEKYQPIQDDWNNKWDNNWQMSINIQIKFIHVKNYSSIYEISYKNFLI